MPHHPTHQMTFLCLTAPTDPLHITPYTLYITALHLTSSAHSLFSHFTVSTFHLTCAHILNSTHLTISPIDTTISPANPSPPLQDSNLLLAYTILPFAEVIFSANTTLLTTDFTLLSSHSTLSPSYQTLVPLSTESFYPILLPLLGQV